MKTGAHTRKRVCAWRFDWRFCLWMAALPSVVVSSAVLSKVPLIVAPRLVDSGLSESALSETALSETALSESGLNSLGLNATVSTHSGKSKRMQNWAVTEASSIGFRVFLFRMVPMEGQFEKITAWLKPTDDQWAVSVSADTNHITMGDARRTRWAKSSEFFDADKHPQIDFVADHIANQTLIEGGKLEGQLTLRGVTRPVRFELRAAPCLQNQARSTCWVYAAATVSRSQFGMQSRKFVVGDKVEIDLKMQLTRSDSKDIGAIQSQNANASLGSSSSNE